MAKFTLEIEENFDFQLIGIFSHTKDYRLCWEINKAFNFDLIKRENYTIHIKGNIQEHSFFNYNDEENLVEYFLINNRSEGGTLISEEKFDYFLVIKGHFKPEALNDFRIQLNQLKPILASSIIEVEELKSKNNLIF